MNQTGTGLILIALSIAAYVLGRFATLRSIGIFAGILMLGFSGAVLHFTARLIAYGGALLGVLGEWAFGVGGGVVVAAIVAVMGFIVLHDWSPKNAAKKRTFFVSAILAVMVVAAGTPFAVLNNLPATLQQGITQTTQGG